MRRSLGEENESVLQPIDHPLDLDVFPQDLEAIRLEFLPQELELGGELLVFVFLPELRPSDELTLAESLHLPGESPDGLQRQVGQPHGDEPGHGQGGPGQTQPLKQRGIQFGPEQAARKPDPDTAERLVIELQRERHLVRRPRLIEPGKAAHRVGRQERAELELGRRRAVLLPSLAVQNDGVGPIGQQDVEDVGGVSDAGLQQAPQLAVGAQGLPRVPVRCPGERAPALGVDLPGDQFRLLRGTLDADPCQLRKMEQCRGRHHEEGEGGNRQHLLGLEPKAHLGPVTVELVVERLDADPEDARGPRLVVTDGRERLQDQGPLRLLDGHADRQRDRVGFGRRATRA